MMTPAELFLEYLKPDAKPDRMLKQYEAFWFMGGDPINAYIRPGRAPGKTIVDRWGTTLVWPADAPGSTPHITPENKVIKDITHWRDYVTVPDLRANCSEGWEQVRAANELAHSKGKLSCFVMGTGMFEQTHFLMGFEDTLTNLYEHPTEMHELIEAIADYRMTYLELLIENAHPDVILSHDDWGAKNSLFMQPDVWREFYKEPYRRFYKYIRDHGVIAMHHADSYLVPIVEDMVELGIQGWQGILPENDVPAVQRQLHGRMFLMGGVGAAIDRADAEEPEIRAYVRRVLEENCPGGYYIPCITYGGPGTVFKHVNPIINSEIDAYNRIAHLSNQRPAPVHREKQRAEAAAVQKKEETAATEESILDMLSMALRKGRKKQVLRLSEEALQQGYTAQQILNDGLVRGMTELGDDFSANRVFVPEMLLAARCMQAATEILKPHLVGASGSTAGRACLGTIKGDMHDIGKNLVKIMMEGSGLEVIDLGCDVAPEIFIQTAIEKNCDVIACSSLLTTTMPVMRNVVELATEKGIRDKVIIMVGGAPTSQSFCDEIGADIYTPDAASAAKAAVNAIAERRGA